MPSIATLARMELNGVGFSEKECETQKKIILARMAQLESEAYKLAGHTFSLTSTDDICQVSRHTRILQPSSVISQHHHTF